ncbi:MAG: hypothetical protein OEM15_09505 [Myxococcales bacterium]|nr:hypothetical protein [Myxococcales bacterium]MDH3483032.1 hypothetical protein [Myxococcales bacterium]
MNKLLVMCILAAGLAVGCGEDVLGTGGSGGTGIIGPLTWDVSGYTVESDGCEAVSPTEPLTAFDVTIEGSDAALESVDLVLGGVTMTYDPADSTVEFTDSFTDGPMAVPDCVVDLMDTFTVVLGDPSVSLDQNTTVQVTWDHDESESDESAMPGACDGAWFVDLPCDSQATFTLTQQAQ